MVNIHGIHELYPGPPGWRARRLRGGHAPVWRPGQRACVPASGAAQTGPGRKDVEHEFAGRRGGIDGTIAQGWLGSSSPLAGSFSPTVKYLWVRVAGKNAHYPGSLTPILPALRIRSCSRAAPRRGSSSSPLSCSGPRWWISSPASRRGTPHTTAAQAPASW